MSKRWLHFLLPLLLSALFFFGCGRKPGEKLYHEALAEWKAGNLVRARTLLEKSIRRRTGSLENSDAYNRLGLLLWESGDPKGAVDAFTESLRLDAGQYDVLCNLGVALNARNDPADAEQTFREASLLQPDNPRLQAFIGIVEVRNQKWEDAKRNLARALQRSPDNPHLQNALALAELHSGSTDQALKRLESITKKNPAYAPALFNIASIHLDWLKNPVEAKKWLELYLSKSSDRDPFSALARSRLETIASEGRIPFTARENPDRKAAEKSFLNALKAHQEGDLDNAIKWYIRAIEEDSTYEQAFYNLGLVYYTQGKMELAGEAFAKAVQLNPAFIAARYNSALVNYRLGNNDRALRELELILTQQPDYQPAVDLIARIRK